MLIGNPWYSSPEARQLSVGAGVSSVFQAQAAVRGIPIVGNTVTGKERTIVHSRRPLAASCFLGWAVVGRARCPGSWGIEEASNWRNFGGKTSETPLFTQTMHDIATSALPRLPGAKSFAARKQYLGILVSQLLDSKSTGD
jgi:hypothetical protein